LNRFSDVLGVDVRTVREVCNRPHDTRDTVERPQGELSLDAGLAKRRSAASSSGQHARIWFAGPSSNG